ncbi:MAG: HK97 family phage prohead protease [Clostridia bacterium]|nr:HK97 family phage prohead protease [Clostridia bacterium]
MPKTKPNLPALERRNYSFEVRAEQDEQHGNIITGRPVVYSRETDIGGWFSEIIEPGALDGTDLSDVRFLVNHDLSKIPLARSRNNTENSTMQLSVDAEGLSIRVTLDTENNAEARALYSAVKRGDITGMSFMFSIDAQRWEDEQSDYPKRHIDKIASIVEVSAVTFPAYEDTEINARGGPLESARAALESAREKAKRQKAPEGADALALAKAKILYIN